MRLGFLIYVDYSWIFYTGQKHIWKLLNGTSEERFSLFYLKC